MLVQVICCHPLADSYCHALFRTVVETLRESRHEVVATDLYAERFDPVLTPQERRAYYRTPYDDSAMASHTALLRRTNAVIFCFPHWWFGMPAMLKGYFDRVWVPGVAFEHDPAGGIKPLLTQTRWFGVVTTYGSPWWVTRIVAGDPGRKVLMRALKPMCRSRVRSFYLAHYDMDRSTERSRRAFLERVRRQVAAI